LPNLHSTLDCKGKAHSKRSGGKKFQGQILPGNISYQSTHYSEIIKWIFKWWWALVMNTCCQQSRITEENRNKHKRKIEMSRNARTRTNFQPVHLIITRITTLITLLQFDFISVKRLLKLLLRI